MPKVRAVGQDQVLAAALAVFWNKGYAETSLGDLVAATGWNRAALYGTFHDKRRLFLAVLGHYATTIVTDDLAEVELAGAGLRELTGYFARRIERAERQGFPAWGCLMANAMTEAAPHDAEVRALVSRHLGRLRVAFERALRQARDRGEMAGSVRTGQRARSLVIAAQGLWNYSRVCAGGAELRGAAGAVLAQHGLPGLQDA